MTRDGDNKISGNYLSPCSCTFPTLLPEVWSSSIWPLLSIQSKRSVRVSCKTAASLCDSLVDTWTLRVHPGGSSNDHSNCAHCGAKGNNSSSNVCSNVCSIVDASHAVAFAQRLSRLAKVAIVVGEPCPDMEMEVGAPASRRQGRRKGNSERTCSCGQRQCQQQRQAPDEPPLQQLLSGPLAPMLGHGPLQHVQELKLAFAPQPLQSAGAPSCSVHALERLLSALPNLQRADLRLVAPPGLGAALACHCPRLQHVTLQLERPEQAHMTVLASPGMVPAPRLRPPQAGRPFPVAPPAAVQVEGYSVALPALAPLAGLRSLHVHASAANEPAGTVVTAAARLTQLSDLVLNMLLRNSNTPKQVSRLDVLTALTRLTRLSSQGGLFTTFVNNPAFRHPYVIRPAPVAPACLVELRLDDETLTDSLWRTVLAHLPALRVACFRGVKVVAGFDADALDGGNPSLPLERLQLLEPVHPEHLRPALPGLPCLAGLQCTVRVDTDFCTVHSYLEAWCSLAQLEEHMQLRFGPEPVPAVRVALVVGDSCSLLYAPRYAAPELAAAAAAAERQACAPSPPLQFAPAEDDEGDDIDDSDDVDDMPGLVEPDSDSDSSPAVLANGSALLAQLSACRYVHIGRESVCVVAHGRHDRGLHAGRALLRDGHLMGPFLERLLGDAFASARSVCLTACLGCDARRSTVGGQATQAVLRALAQPRRERVTFDACVNLTDKAVLHTAELLVAAREDGASSSGTGPGARAGCVAALVQRMEYCCVEERALRERSERLCKEQWPGVEVAFEVLPLGPWWPDAAGHGGPGRGFGVMQLGMDGLML